MVLWYCIVRVSWCGALVAYGLLCLGTNNDQKQRRNQIDTVMSLVMVQYRGFCRYDRVRRALGFERRPVGLFVVTVAPVPNPDPRLFAGNWKLKSYIQIHKPTTTYHTRTYTESTYFCERYRGPTIGCCNKRCLSFLLFSRDCYGNSTGLP